MELFPENKFLRGKIYKITSPQTDKTYYGSTCEPTLEKRLNGHKSEFNKFLNGRNNYISSFEIIKFEDNQIELVESYPCENRGELLKRERHYIENFPCVNKVIPGRTRQETNRAYWQANRIKLLELRKLNADKINEYSRSKVNCICGKVVTRGGYSIHKKSIFHQNFLNNINNNLIASFDNLNINN
jgi:hypothetical protein